MWRKTRKVPYISVQKTVQRIVHLLYLALLHLTLGSLEKRSIKHQSQITLLTTWKLFSSGKMKTWTRSGIKTDLDLHLSTLIQRKTCRLMLLQISTWIQMREFALRLKLSTWFQTSSMFLCTSTLKEHSMGTNLQVYLLWIDWCNHPLQLAQKPVHSINTWTMVILLPKMW